MKATIDGDTLTVTIDLHEGELSESGKTYSVGYEQGKKIANYKGHPITVQINAFYKAKDEPAAPAKVAADVFHADKGDGSAVCDVPVKGLALGVVPQASFLKLSVGARCAVCASRLS